jgi:SAM-dependent methyltransferase
MGLDINMATILADWIERYAIAGPMLTLGVQQLSFTSEQFRQADNRRDQERGSAITTAADLFSACGIEATFSLDISTDEGADFLFDLNNPLPPPDLVSRFAAVLNGGTLEHVFNLPNALSAITRLLRPGGCALHVVPVHNWVDHGFYQISPTLLFDYYTAARFEILEAAALFYPERQPDRCEIEPLVPGACGVGSSPDFGHHRVLCMFAARKAAGARDEATPIQSLYAAEPVRPPPSLRWFAPYSLTGGVRQGGECTRYALGPFRREEGRAWLAALPGDIAEGDAPDAPVRSRLALFEDGRLLGPAHAPHALIRAKGGGCYSHWRDSLLFSSSDGSDPNRNGRYYTAIIPRP